VQVTNIASGTNTDAGTDTGPNGGPDDDAGTAGVSRLGLGFGLGHRVVEKIAALHGATFDEVPGAPGQHCYRLTFPQGVTPQTSPASRR